MYKFRIVPSPDKTFRIDRALRGWITNWLYDNRTDTIEQAYTYIEVEKQRWKEYEDKKKEEKEFRKKNPPIYV